MYFAYLHYLPIFKLNYQNKEKTLTSLIEEWEKEKGKEERIGGKQKNFSTKVLTNS